MQILPFDNRSGYIWFNGEFISWNDAKIHVLNHGLHYGSCVFEGLRISSIDLDLIVIEEPSLKNLSLKLL